MEGGKQGIRANFLLAATRMSRPASCSASGSPPDRFLLLQQQLNDRASLSWLNRLKQDKDTPRYAPNKTSRQVNALSLSVSLFLVCLFCLTFLLCPTFGWFVSWLPSFFPRSFLFGGYDEFVRVVFPPYF